MARYRKHVVQGEDTVRSIAQQYTNNPNFWRRIVSYNNLTYPYIVYTLEKKKQNPETWVTLGDTLIIPIEQELGDIDVGSLGKRDTDLIEHLTLGSDLSVSTESVLGTARGGEDEILELSGDGEGDVHVARGINNIKQAIINRLLTRRGSLLLHPSYGSNIHKILGRPADSLTQDQLDNEIQRVIKSDGRVIGVRLNRSTIEDDVYRADLTVTIRGLEEGFQLLVEGGEGGMTIE